MPGAQVPDDDDLDARFDELIGHNFPGAATRRHRPGPGTPLAPPPPTPRDEQDPPLTVLDAMDRADAEAGDFVPPPPRTGPWPLPMQIGMIVMGGGLVVGALALLGVGMTRGVGFAGASAFVVGLGVLLGWALTRKAPPRDPGDDGARL